MTRGEVILVGGGERARAFDDVLSRSARLVRVATVARHGSRLPGPVFSDVSPALEAFPDASVLVALPPRASLDVALMLAERGRRAVVQAPLDLSLATNPLPPQASAIELAHGWVTLQGRKLAQRLVAQRPLTRVSVDVRGLPESTDGDVEEVLWHALSLVRKLFPHAQVRSSARPHGGVVTVQLEAGATVVEARVVTNGAELHVAFEGPRTFADWSFQNGQEVFGLRGEGRPPPWSPRPATERAVAQLLDPQGETLVEGQAIAKLVEAALQGLGERLPPGQRRLRLAARLHAERPDELFAQLGLRGELPDAPPGAPMENITETDEFWAFQAGLKPVAFLTLLPSEVAATIARYGDVHVERRDRFVESGPQDVWVDKRDRGEARAELYISKDPVLARRAADVQVEDPTNSIRILGELMGYPPCCTAAFAGQDDRANNTRNRYATAARTMAAPPWPWELNNLVLATVPFFPCRFDCPHARRWARRVMDDFTASDPRTGARRRQLLAQPTLYFDHDRVLVFEGVAVSEERVEFRRVRTGREGPLDFARLAGAIAQGNALEWSHRALTVWRDAERLFTLARTDPALGFLAPFGDDGR